MKLVFVSSTFKDMQYERDMLQTYAIPVLDDALKQYGEKAYFGDLRWGVNTTDLDSDEGSKKVLQVCLDQIDNCKPYMIVLIGERYGWIPAQELIDEACVLKGIEKIKDISVTELEIDYGALLNPECEGRVMFYFRDLDTTGMTEQELRDYKAESPVHAEKIADLKRRIEETYPNQIRRYKAKWDASAKEVVDLGGFLEMVQKDLSDVLLKDLEALNQIPWQERCMQSAHKWFTEQNKYIVDSFRSRTRYKGYLAEMYPWRIHYITGLDGSGKSSWVIKSYNVEYNEDYSRIAFSFGLDKYSEKSEQFFQVLFYRMEELLGLEHKSFDFYNDSDLFFEAMELMAERNLKILVCVDNAGRHFIQDLYSFDQWGNEYFGIKWLYMFECFRFVIAVTEDMPAFPLFSVSKVEEIDDLTPEHAEFVLDSIIKSNHKELSDVVKERILSKEESKSASYLRCVVKRLMILDSEDFAKIRAMGDGMDNINKYMLSIVDSVADSRKDVYLELVDEAKDRIDSIFVERLMSLFAFVPVNLSVAEIKNIFTALNWEYNDLSFSLAARMLEDIIPYNVFYGLYTVKNNDVRKLLQHYAGNVDLKPVVNYMLTDEVLRPYAFRVAVMTDDVEFAVNVLYQVENTVVKDDVKYFVEHEQIDRAVKLLVHLVGRDDFKGNVFELLPDYFEYSYKFMMESDKVYPLQPFTEALSSYIENNVLFPDNTADNYNKENPRILTESEYRIFMLYCNAELIMIRSMEGEAPYKKIGYLNWLIKFAQKMNRGVDTYIYVRIILQTLKVVNGACSQEMAQKYIQYENFVTDDLFDGSFKDKLLRAKIYRELGVAFDRLSNYDKEQEFIDKTAAIVDEITDELFEGDNLSVVTEEDLVFLALVTGDYTTYYSYARILNPASLMVIESEILHRNSSSAVDEDEVFDYENEEADLEDERQLNKEIAVADAYDAVMKALVLAKKVPTDERDLNFVSALCVFCGLWGSEDDFDADLIFGKLYDRFIHNVNHIIKHDYMRLRNYTDLLFMFDFLCGYSNTDEEKERLLAAMEWDEPLAIIIRGFVEHAVIKKNRRELKKLHAEYLKIRDNYCFYDNVAVTIVDECFAEKGFGTPSADAIDENDTESPRMFKWI